MIEGLTQGFIDYESSPTGYKQGTDFSSSSNNCINTASTLLLSAFDISARQCSVGDIESFLFVTSCNSVLDYLIESLNHNATSKGG